MQISISSNVNFLQVNQRPCCFDKFMLGQSKNKYKNSNNCTAVVLVLFSIVYVLQVILGTLVLF